MDMIVEGITGGLGGCLGRLLAFPFETLKLKKSLDPNASILAILTDVKGLYTGVFWSALEALIHKAVQMFAVAKLRLLYAEKFGRRPDSLAISIAIGYIADVACLWSTIPLENIVARMQKDPKSFSLRTDILSVAFLRTFLQQLPVFLILSWKTGMEIGIFDRLKERWIAKRGDEKNTSPKTQSKRKAEDAEIQSLPAGQAFLMGAVARFISTLVIYPYIFAKSLAVSGHDTGAGKFGITSALIETCKRDGPRAVFAGVEFEIIRGVSQSAIMFFLMETLRKRVRTVVTLLQRGSPLRNGAHA